jgi:hypothetical protein
MGNEMKFLPRIVCFVICMAANTGVNAQTYTSVQWGMDRTSTPSTVCIMSGSTCLSTIGSANISTGLFSMWVNFLAVKSAPYSQKNIVISSAPSYTGPNDVPTYFNGDFSNTVFPYQVTINGVATLGQPTTGYQRNPAATPISGILINNSGWNQSTSGNDGRTGITQSNIYLRNNGQGDVAHTYYYASITAPQRAGATNWLANPQVGLFGGDITTFTPHTYLQAIGDLNFSDNTNDVAAIGDVMNMFRTNSTAALGDVWMGHLVGSIGAAAGGTGSISGTTLTITAKASFRPLTPNQTITGTGIADGTIITAQLSGTTGGIGTYTVNNSQIVASTTITAVTPIDVAYNAGGAMNVVFDATQVNNSFAAVNMKTGQKIRLNSTSTPLAGIRWYGNNYGDSWLQDSSAASEVQIGYNDVPAAAFTAQAAATDYPLLGALASNAGAYLAAESSSANAPLVYVSKGVSGHYFKYAGLSGTSLLTLIPTGSIFYTPINIAALVPVISSCGTSPPAASAGSSQNAGQFTLGTGSPTACTITYVIPYPNYAYCTVTPASNYTGTYYISAQSKTAFTVTLGTGTSSAIFNYICFGN